ncbi:gamma-glutamyltransferase [Wenzhouxiangella limi]|uniref:Gamma-glutamyltransferase n=1 Tax=Wenzhouxiangella limi TaxID=2707351 RepID=A0A845V1X3_9GAMM|nr:gamma-glutamyltransferase [Wenzhouxiangella limi]NDY94281.1 gamma-glutamyltransferase [Wenzhouxiangella limi]
MASSPPSWSWRIATGHSQTTRAAQDVLDDGGNAADAAVAAALAASLAEPLLCSLGGGGHALVQRDGQAPLALDFFAQSPRRRRSGELDFYPIVGNFGPDTQEFHVGMASIATPGVVAGLFALHQRYGSRPMSELVAPAVGLGRDGLTLNRVQAFTLAILEPIVRATDPGARVFGLADRTAPLPNEGDPLQNPELADFLEALGREGPALFYQGEAARRLARDSVEQGGHLRLEDLSGYRARWRRPLRWRYRDAVLWSTPPPAFGGIMLALACQRLALHLGPRRGGFGSPAHLQALCLAMAESEDLRTRLEQPEMLASDRALRAAFAGLSGHAHQVSRRGTTHISIDDGRGLAVALTLSNGEASGYVIPGTGIIMNNMLGEEDLNRSGFHNWPVNRRLASMMAPTIIRRGEHRYLLGSGGSNRIRTALAQVICNLIDFGMDLRSAVNAPRIHLERGHLSVELAERWPPEAQDWLMQHFRDARAWPERNLFFGGVHAAGPDSAAADSRRGGHAAVGDR